MAKQHPTIPSREHRMVKKPLANVLWWRPRETWVRTKQKMGDPSQMLQMPHENEDVHGPM